MRKPLLLLLSAILSVSSMLAQEPVTRYKDGKMAPIEKIGKATERNAKSVADLPLPLRVRKPVSGLPIQNTGVTAPARKTADVSTLPRMIGTVVAADNWTEDNYPIGLYNLPVGPNSEFTLLNANVGTSAGHVKDEIYYNCKVWVMAAKVGADWSGYDLKTGERVFYRETYDNQYFSYSTSVDPTTGVVYGLNLTNNGQGFQIVTIDYIEDDGYGWNNVEVTSVGALNGRWAAIAFDSTGQLWGISYDGTQTGNLFTVTDSYLHKIDKATGATTLVGATGQAPQYATDMDFDLTTNKLYWTIETLRDSGYLTEVNTTTGVATPILYFPHNEQVLGLVTMPTPAPGTPERVTNVSTTFEGGNLTGTVNFTTPSVNTDGATGTGQLTYTVLANGTQVGTGSCSYNQTVNAPVTLPTGGTYKFSVTVTSSAGKTSHAVYTETIVGFGTPKATEATASWADGKMTIAWERPTETVDGGYLSPTDPFTYVIANVANGLNIATVNNQTSYTFDLAEPEQRTVYQFRVTGTCNGLSFTSLTNLVYVGPESAPYFNDFNSSTALDGYTIIDANNDGTTWKHETTEVKISWNATKSMDDWLITPAIYLQAGLQYPFSIDARLYNIAYSEMFEVKAGLAPTAEDMTISIIPETVPTKITFDTFTGMLCPEVSGRYYIGVHGISPRDQHTLIVDNLSLEAPLSTSLPTAVQNLTVTPNSSGALNAVVSFVTPTQDVSGNPINLSKIIISVDGVDQKTITSPAPGTSYSETITVFTKGEHTVDVTSFNTENESTTVSVSVHIGFDLPAISEWVKLSETAPGVVDITWEPVTADINGLPIPASDITYDIWSIKNGALDVCIAEGHQGTSLIGYDFNMVPGQQQFMQFAVYAYTSAGGGGGRLSNMIAIGYPSDGYKESFTDGDISNPLMIVTLAGAPNWTILRDFNGIPSQDNDNGLIALIGEYSYDQSALVTGKVSLADLTNPHLRFYVRNSYNPENDYPENENTVVVKVAEVGSDEYVPILQTTYYAIGGTKEGWCPVDLDLAAYAGKDVSFWFETTTASYSYAPWDNIYTYSYVPHNIAVTNISAPARVEAGSDFTVTVALANQGYLPTEDYTVELYQDGTLVATKPGPAIAAEDSGVIEFPMTMHALASDDISFHAVAVYALDARPENNQSAAITVKPSYTGVPKVHNLWGEWIADGVDFTWDEPDYLNGMPTTITDDFESYTPWSSDFGNWLTVDNDFHTLGGYLGFPIPGVTPSFTQGTFMIFDGTAPEDPIDLETFAAHSGHQYAGAIYNYYDEALDDWMISPKLSGNAQVISFYARSCSRYFLDSFQIMISTSGTELNDFKALTDIITPERNWDQYNFDLPAGTKYFAIRACGANSYLLMIDDVTYQSGIEFTPLVLKGYNIWRDGVKLNSELIPECHYVDNVAAGEYHSYVVTAVYDKGESRASTAFNTDPAGIETPTVQAQIEAVYSTSGIEFAPDAELTPGVYIIRYTDGRIAKTVIR